MEDEKLALYDENGNLLEDDYINDEDNADIIVNTEPEKESAINRFKKLFK